MRTRSASLDFLPELDPNRKEVCFGRFFNKAVKNEAKSAEAGRPIFEDKVYVEILIPADRTSSPCREAYEEDFRRFPGAYEAFQKGVEAKHEGMALSEWPQATRSQVEELAYFHVHTVEQLAGTSDSSLQNLGHYVGLRQRARDYLEAANAGVGLSKLRAELEARDATIRALQESVETLKSQIKKK